MSESTEPTPKMAPTSTALNSSTDPLADEKSRLLSFDVTTTNAIARNPSPNQLLSFFNCFQFTKTQENQQASVSSSISNLTNTIIGAGMLGLPYALSKCGLAVGIPLFVVFGFLSFLGIHFLALVGREIKDVSFTKASEATIPRLKTLVDIAVSIKCFGVCVSYLIACGDLLPRVILAIDNHHPTDWLLYDRRFWITTVFILLIVPFIRFRQMDTLKFTSTLALACFTYVTIIVVLYALFPESFPACGGHGNSCRGDVLNGPQSMTSFIAVVPIFVLTYTCQENVFDVTIELEDPTPRRLNIVGAMSTFLCFIVYATVSYAGYSTYGSAVQSNILVNYPDTPAITILRALLSLAIAWSYPLSCHPCRKCLAQVIFGKEAKELPNLQFYMLTAGIALSTWVIAMTVTDFGIVLSLGGATGATILAFILPGIFYFKFFSSGIERYFALALCIFGCIFLPFALTIIILDQ